MKKVQIQFHADAREMIDRAVDWARTHDLSIAAEEFFPAYRAFGLLDQDVARELPSFERIDRLALKGGRFDLTATTAQQFVSMNEGSLFLSIDWPTKDGVRESALGGVTNDPELLRTWRLIINDFKRSAHRGAVIRAAFSAATSPVATHLHTVGAHELAQQGTKMLAAAGSNEYIFDDVSAGT